MTLPRRQTSAMSARLKSYWYSFGFAQRRGLGVGRVLLLADVGVAQDVHPLRVRRHQPVLDSVVHHLDEVAGAVGPAMQVAVLGGAAR